MSERRGGARLWLVFFVCLLGVLYMIGSSGEGGGTRRRSRTAAEAQVDKAAIEAVQHWLASGVLHSVDVEANSARIDPLGWSALTIEDKQQTVRILSAYFDAKRGYDRVTILSSRNDTKLATYSPLGGCKILY